MTVAFWVLVNGLLFLPAKTFRNVPLFFPQEDKIVHLAIFGTLAALVRWSIPARWGRGGKRIAVIMALAAYGVLTECIQPLIPNAARLFEWGDILMDCMGVVMGVWLCGCLARTVAINAEQQT